MYRLQSFTTMHCFSISYMFGAYNQLIIIPRIFSDLKSMHYALIDTNSCPSTRKCCHFHLISLFTRSFLGNNAHYMFIFAFLSVCIISFTVYKSCFHRSFSSMNDKSHSFVFSLCNFLYFFHVIRI